MFYLRSDDGEYESRLSQSKLLQLCEYDPIITFVKACDQLLYQTLVEILIPDVLRPIPGTDVLNFSQTHFTCYNYLHIGHTFAPCVHPFKTTEKHT